MKETNCPACQSRKTRTAGRFKGLETKQPPNEWWQFSHESENRLCQECGTAWRPACPRWTAIFFIVAGIAEFIGTLYVEKWNTEIAAPARITGIGVDSIGYPLLGIMGLSAMYTGCRLLFGDSGRMKILGKFDDSGK